MKQVGIVVADLCHFGEKAPPTRRKGDNHTILARATMRKVDIIRAKMRRHVGAFTFSPFRTVEKAPFAQISHHMVKGLMCLAMIIKTADGVSSKPVWTTCY